MILDRFSSADRVAVVTGAGRGIGRASAPALAEAGADVVPAARDLAPRIGVNAIAAGSVATSALDVVMTDDGLRTEMEANTPAGAGRAPRRHRRHRPVPGLAGRRPPHRQGGDRGVHGRQHGGLGLAPGGGDEHAPARPNRDPTPPDQPDPLSRPARHPRRGTSCGTGRGTTRSARSSATMLRAPCWAGRRPHPAGRARRRSTRRP